LVGEQLAGLISSVFQKDAEGHMNNAAFGEINLAVNRRFIE
jgi:hypothetical protein